MSSPIGLSVCRLSTSTMSSQKKFTFAISSPDEFLVLRFFDSDDSSSNNRTCDQRSDADNWRVIVLTCVSSSSKVVMLSQTFGRRWAENIVQLDSDCSNSAHEKDLNICLEEGKHSGYGR